MSHDQSFKHCGSQLAIASAHLHIAVYLVAVVVAGEVEVLPVAHEVHLREVEVTQPDLGVLLQDWQMPKNGNVDASRNNWRQFWRLFKLPRAQHLTPPLHVLSRTWEVIARRRMVLLPLAPSGL